MYNGDIERVKVHIKMKMQEIGMDKALLMETYNVPEEEVDAFIKEAADEAERIAHRSDDFDEIVGRTLKDALNLLYDSDDDEAKEFKNERRENGNYEKGIS